MNKKCSNCKHRRDVQPWCKGCENNFPGVDQFDFYQPIEHNIQMLEVNGSIQASYDHVVSCDVKNGTILLTCADGSTASFPNDGSWRMLDLTPTYGWNENPGVIPEIHNKRQIKITLIRQRSWENSTWVDDIFLVMDAAQFDAKGTSYWENPENVERELRQAICGWLQTKEGWKANVRSSFDFNWGDFISELPIELPNIKLSGEKENWIAINAAPSIVVNQDTKLASYHTPAVLMRSDGTQFGTGIVDFQVGGIHLMNPNQVIPEHDGPILVRPEGSNETEFIAHWDSKHLRYFLDT